MFFNNLLFLILLYRGIITFANAQNPVKVLVKEESVINHKIADKVQVENAKIRADISDISVTQDQIIEKLSNLEKQIAQLMQNTLTTQSIDHKESIDVVTKSNFEPLRFNTRCGPNAEVINNGKTALRKDPHSEYDYASVLTQRPLRSNELFEVRLERLVTRWDGNLRIGVTTHSAEEMNFSGDMNYDSTDTWVMIFTDVFHNEKRITDSYGQDLNELKKDDRVGVMRKDDASLHFYVNGLDQGVAAENVPADVYGVIDLYGKAAEASIVDNFK